MKLTQEDIENLVNLTYETPSLGGLLQLGPCGAGREVVERIYRNSLEQ